MTLGSLGICSCGYIAVARCTGCGVLLCEEHASKMPEPPEGVSENAKIKFAGAIRLVGGQACENCRAARGRQAINDALSAPRAILPSHWLDKAIALSQDQTRSQQEREFDGQLPVTLTPHDVAAEFLRRIGKEPHESVAVTEATMLHKSDMAFGWKVDGRKSDYTHYWPGGGTERYPLPLLISMAGELLGPVADDGHKQSAVWFLVPDSDIDLRRMVDSVAGLLILAPFSA